MRAGVVAAALAIVIALALTLDSVQRSLAQPVSPGELRVQPGANLGSVFADLESSQRIEKAPSVRLVSRLHPELTAIKAGTYEVPERASL